MQTQATMPSCSQCGKPVGKNKMRKPKRYCSIACFSAFRKTLPPKTCETCGAPMDGGRPSRPRRFCGYACSTVPTVPIEERFWPKVNKDGPTIRPELGPCWVWTAATDGRGYGKIGRGRAGEGAAGAHCVSWEIHVGPIPDALYVLHHCDNPPCVRPDHLFLGTIQDNSIDMLKKGRASAAKLTEDQVVTIRQRFASGETQTSLGRIYGVSQFAISCIVLRKTWRHVA